jgi:hypothetical protein
VIPVALILALLVSTTLFNATAANDALDTVVVISDSTDIQSGKVLKNAAGDGGAKIQAQTDSSLEQVNNTVTSLDMETFHAADESRQNEIKGFLKSEYDNDKKIVFLAEEESVVPDDIYQLLDLQPEFAITNTDNLVGMSVENLDGVAVATYYVDNNSEMNTINKILGWIVNSAVLNSILSSVQYKQAQEISTQRQLEGSGNGSYVWPVVVSNESDIWEATLVFYMSRTLVTGAKTTSPISTWECISQLTFRPRKSVGGHTLSVVNVYHTLENNKTLLSGWPGTSVGTTSTTVSVSAGINSDGVANVGVGFSQTRQQSEINVTHSLNVTNRTSSWKYDYDNESNAAKNGGFYHIQKSTLTNATPSGVFFFVEYSASCGGGCTTNGAYFPKNGFGITIRDQKA